MSDKKRRVPISLYPPLPTVGEGIVKSAKIYFTLANVVVKLILCHNLKSS